MEDEFELQGKPKTDKALIVEKLTDPKKAENFAEELMVILKDAREQLGVAEPKVKISQIKRNLRSRIGDATKKYIRQVQSQVGTDAYAVKDMVNALLEEL